MTGLPHHDACLSRRDLLARGGAGFGAVALAGLLGAADPQDPLAPRAPRLRARARSVIFLFMEGGPSHLDTFDPKPLLDTLAGKRLPESFGTVLTAMGEQNSPLLASKRKWDRHGKGGLWVSDWLPHLARCADDLTVIRSCVSDGLNHSGGVCQMNTGSVLGGRPSLGSWVTYGLGTENRNLPAFVVLQDNPTPPTNGPRNWSAGFMPGVYQGTRLENGPTPIAHLATPESIGDERQRQKLDYLHRLNRLHAEARAESGELDARIRSYELAFRMQAEAPGAVDLSAESDATRALYGIGEKETDAFGKNCLLARRLVERGVRFVQIYSGSGSKWDAHSDIEGNHSGLCRSMDKPAAGLLTDLKARGLLDETLVLWGGEFGRTPMSEKGNGRDHNPWGFTMWMAGAGLPGGRTVGATDDLGLRAVEDPVHVHDLHATILSLMGLDHTKLIYLHKGRPERVDMNEGHVARKILGA